MVDGLSKLHYEDLQKSGLNDETIIKAKFKTIAPDKIDKVLGFKTRKITSMYEIPYPNTEHSRFKVFYDPEHKEKNKPKYLQKKGSGNRLYIPEDIQETLSKPDIELFITEGEKKALKAVQEGLPCIGLSGLWGWSIKEKGELIEDFNKIEVKNRKVCIIPDNDWLDQNKHGYNKNLKQAVYKLAKQLIDRSAKVSIMQIPNGR